ncbi:MAG TPA: hypothetical protein VL484_04405 [Vicinamibacterales bacterium]|jgi:hypothetical protein|nr:hypothetical protein [Vicinamibacterales bacterium]
MGRAIHAAASALGIRVKSGWASAVFVGLNAETPIYLHRHRLLLSDPDVPQSSQPYHRGFGSLQQDRDVIRRLTRIVHTAARRSLQAALTECATMGHGPQTIALVVGSTIDPLTVGNEHIRAHAYEARLFRESLERAASAAHLSCVVYRERDLSAIAAKALGPVASSVVAAMGQTAGRPWRADEKLAALAAWVVCDGGNQ